MRFTFLVLSLFAVFAIPAAAHADTVFTISIDGGTAVTYLLPAAPDEVHTQYFVYTTLPNLSGNLYIFDPTFMPSPDGPLNLEIWNGVTDYLFTGPQLYSGTLANPVFGPGTFSLDPFSSGTHTAVLTIDGGAVSSVTPEPSSLALLGTGIFGVFGVVRRRFTV